jgi:hypothetical protein
MAHFRIKIGQSSEDILHYTLPDGIHYSKTFLTDPFGSNRTRYQYPEVFSYVLENNELIITKNKRNVSKVTSNLFNEKGWNLMLTVSNIPNDTEWNTYTEIEKILPKDYASVTINKKVQKSYLYGIVIPTFGRLEYVSKSLESLRDSNLSKNDTLIVIVDESNTKEVDKDKEETKEWIEKFDIDGIAIIKIFKNRHGNMFDSLLIGLDLIYQKCKYVMNLDSDTIHKKGWLDNVKYVYELVENDYPSKLIVVTGYNSNHHEIEEKRERYIIKKSLGGCHLFFRSIDYVNYLRYTLISNKWDTNLYEQVKRLGGVLVSTNPSTIEHIGEISSVRSEKNTDKSIDY